MGRESDKAIYSQAQVQILKDIVVLDTTQKLLLNEFKEHKREDDEHFGRLYDADKKILNEIGKIPERMMKCRDDLKDDIMTQAKDEFVNQTDFKVFQTKILMAVVTTGVIASIATGVLTAAVLLAKLQGITP